MREDRVSNEENEYRVGFNKENGPGQPQKVEGESCCKCSMKARHVCSKRVLLLLWTQFPTADASIQDTRAASEWGTEFLLWSQHPSIDRLLHDMRGPLPTLSGGSLSQSSHKQRKESPSVTGTQQTHAE